MSPVSKRFLPLEFSKDALHHKTALCLSSAEAPVGQGHDQVVTAFQLLLGTQQRVTKINLREWGNPKAEPGLAASKPTLPSLEALPFRLPCGHSV